MNVFAFSFKDVRREIKVKYGSKKSKLISVKELLEQITTMHLECSENRNKEKYDWRRDITLSFNENGPLTLENTRKNKEFDFTFYTYITL
ncbi:hypothetical protein HMI55_005394 [Coelomomyces lativittatus]|nr:hypothetical protein HMI55_005394 [Coelomomyces lativittatus]